ncbi:PLP-dependent aspartate aminotransferase family protein [Vibrio tritonius]|uniref:trans-sulfuration enzyme family protein n=1 Tax=Vibrio tritonius TaxID=1435069 RepID=UPI00315C5B90
MSAKSNRYTPETAAVRAFVDPEMGTQAISPSMVMSVNHCFDPQQGAFSAQGLEDLSEAPYLYAGWSNPTVDQLEQRLAHLEGAEACLTTATGMAAIAGLFLSLLKQGDHLIISDVCYAGVYEFATQVLPDYGIDVTAVDTSDITQVLSEVRKNTKLVHIETPSNPLLTLTDIKALASELKKSGTLLSVDATFSTPVITKPLAFGADFVVHSLTKFINGHGDVLGGAILGSKSHLNQVRARAGVYLGATLSAQSAWLIMRGMETLYPRMKTLCSSALSLATWLEHHPRVKRVLYPGLASHHQFELAQQQMAIFGGIIAFQVDDIDLIQQRFVNESHVFYYAFSIGHQRSLAVAMKTDELDQSTYHFTEEKRAAFRAFAGDGVIRLSIGLEATEDLQQELEHLLR